MEVDEGPADADRYIGEEELDEGEIMMMMDNKELLKEKLVDNDFFNDFEDDLREDDVK